MNKATLKTLILVFTLMLSVGLYAPITAPRAYAFPTTVIGDVPEIVHRELDAIGWMVAKTAVNSLTQSIVNWINSGFEGSPAFVTDLNHNLSNLADAVAEDYIRGLDDVVMNNTGFSVRAPFQDQIARALREEYYRSTSTFGFDSRYPYRDCYEGRGFNWNSYLCQRDEANNPYGRYMLARNELFNALDQAAQNRLEEIRSGRGFLSWRGKCEQPGRSSGSATQTEGGAVDLSSREKNYNCEIRTPGAVIEQTLGISATSPFRQLELADNINEIVGALASQLVNQVLGGSGLSGVSRPSSGGGPSYLDRATNPATNILGGYAVSFNDLRTELQAGQQGWQRVRDTAAEAQRACSQDNVRRNQAEETVAYANENLSVASSALNELAAMEAERVRLTTSASQGELTALTNRYQSLLSRTGGVVAGVSESKAVSGTLVSEMNALAVACR